MEYSPDDGCTHFALAMSVSAHCLDLLHVAQVVQKA